MKISVIGIGRLGLAAALCFAKKFKVLGMDTNRAYVENLNNKTFKSEEPQICDLLQEVGDNFRATTSLEEAVKWSKNIFVYVPTPTRKGSDEYDHTILDKVIREIISATNEWKNIIIGCTVMPGYFSEMNSIRGHNLFYNPEFIAQGSIVRDFMNPDMVLIGSFEQHLGKQIEDLYRQILPPSFTNYRTMSINNAEICKIALNGFITMKIAYANLIGDCVSNGDAQGVLDAIASDKRVGPHAFKYGYSFGGPCFPRDTHALSETLKRKQLSYELVKQIHVINEEHIRIQATHLENWDSHQIFEGVEIREQIPPIDCKNHYIFTNVTYKPMKVPIIDESPKLKIAEILVARGHKVTIKDTPQIIDEVKKKYRDMFKYKII